MNSIPSEEATIAAIFDMDGTLVDNMPYHVTAWQAFCAAHSLPFSLDTYYRDYNGRTSQDIFRMMFGRPLSEQELHDFTEEKEELYRELYRPHLKPLPGTIDFLTDLRAHGVKLAVATSAPLSNLEFTLSGAGLAPYFEEVVYGAMVKQSKPNPQIYLLTAQKLGIDPAQCVVFEDAFLGIEAGQNAGMRVVGMTTNHPANELAPTTVLQLTDFTGMNFEKLKAVIKGI